MDFTELEHLVNNTISEREKELSVLDEKMKAARAELASAESAIARAKVELSGSDLVAAQARRDAASQTLILLTERKDVLQRAEVAGQSQAKQKVQDYMRQRHFEAWKKLGPLIDAMGEIDADLEKERAEVYRLGAKIGVKDYGVTNRRLHDLVTAAQGAYKKPLSGGNPV